MLSSTPESLKVYQAYPRRVAKPIALRAILKAINVFGYEHVLKRTQEFAKRCNGRDLSFVPYPATFFNQERFNDDYDAMFPPVNGSKPIADIPIWQRLKATEAALEALKKKEPQIPSKWLASKEVYEAAVKAAQPFYEQRKKLKAQLELLNSQLAGL